VGLVLIFSIYVQRYLWLDYAAKVTL